MDPKLNLLLPQLIAQLRAQNNAQSIQAALELRRYLASGGQSTLSPVTLALVEPRLRQQGASLTGGAEKGMSQDAEQGPSQASAAGLPMSVPGQSPPTVGTGAQGVDPNAPGNPTYGNTNAGPTAGYNPFEGTPGMGGAGGAPVVQPPQPAAASGGPRDNQTPDYPGRAPAPSAGAPTGTPQGSGSSTLPGGFSAAQGNILTQDDNQLLRFAMQAAGFNPDVLTPATKIAMRALQGMVQARRAAFGGGAAGQNVGGLPQDIASFAKEYTTPGVDFYGHARDYAQGLMGGKDFQSFIGGLADPMDQFNMYQALTPLLYGGSNPLIQQSVSDQLKRQQGLYGDQQFNAVGTPAGQTSILDFIRNQPNLNPALRSIFGPQR